MTRDELVAKLDEYFWIADVSNDASWGETYDFVGGPYWREYAEPTWVGRWNGLMVRGGEAVERVATCVFPSAEIVDGLEPRTFLFSEHPVALEDDVVGFEPLPRSTFETLREREISFYHAHAPLDHHPDVSPSRLCARGLGIEELDEYFPIADGIPGGAAVIGPSGETVEGLRDRLASFLGEGIPVEIVRSPRDRAGRVAVAGGGGADRRLLEESLERGCETFVTGNAATRCRIGFVQDGVRAFLELADEEGVAVIDGTHYGTEIPPQLAMAEWFRALGLEAVFVPGRPERG